MSIGRKIAFVLSLALVVVTGVMGIYNGITERSTGTTNLQKSVTAGVFLYGVLGLITAYGLFRRRGWSVGAAIAWGIVITYVAGVAAIAYAGEDASWIGAVAGSAVTALLAAGVVWTTGVVTGNNKMLPTAN